MGRAIQNLSAQELLKLARERGVVTFRKTSAPHVHRLMHPDWGGRVFIVDEKRHGATSPALARAIERLEKGETE